MSIEIIGEIMSEIKEVMDKNVVVINIVERTSPAYYNYKTRYIAIYIPPSNKAYEDEDIVHISTYSIYCGEFQEIQYCEDVQKELEKLGFKIIER